MGSAETLSSLNLLNKMKTHSESYVHVAAAILDINGVPDLDLLHDVYEPLLKAWPSYSPEVRDIGEQIAQISEIIFQANPIQGMVVHTLNNGRIAGLIDKGLILKTNDFFETPLQSAKSALHVSTPTFDFDGPREHQINHDKRIRGYHPMLTHEFESARSHLIETGHEITMTITAIANLIGAHYSLLSHAASENKQHVANRADNMASETQRGPVKELLPYIALADKNERERGNGPVSIEKIYAGGLLRAFRGEALQSYVPKTSTEIRCPFSRSLAELWGTNIVQDETGKYEIGQQPRAGAFPAFIHRMIQARPLS